MDDEKILELADDAGIYSTVCKESCEFTKDELLTFARALLAAQPQAVPEGMVMVPKQLLADCLHKLRLQHETLNKEYCGGPLLQTLAAELESAIAQGTK